MCLVFWGFFLSDNSLSVGQAAPAEASPCARLQHPRPGLPAPRFACGQEQVHPSAKHALTADPGAKIRPDTFGRGPLSDGKPRGHLRRARGAQPGPAAPPGHRRVPGQGRAGGGASPVPPRGSAPGRRQKGAGRSGSQRHRGPGVGPSPARRRHGPTGRGKSCLLPPAPLPPTARRPFSRSPPPPSLPGFPQPPGPPRHRRGTRQRGRRQPGERRSSRCPLGAETAEQLETNLKPPPHLDPVLGPRTLPRTWTCHAPGPSLKWNPTGGASLFPPFLSSALPHGCDPCPHGSLSPRYPGGWVSCHPSVRVSR